MINDVMTPRLRQHLLAAISQEGWTRAEKAQASADILSVPVMSSVYGTPAEGAIDYFGCWVTDLKAVRR